MVIKLYAFKIIFILIICLGAFLRLYNLDKSPPSLNWDETAWGYNAYSISQSFTDEYGKVLPVFTRSFDEYKSTLPMYLMIPTIQIFGLNEIGVRFPSAFIGVLSIILIYLLAKEIFNDKKVAILSSFVFAIAPWAVHLSRVYHDANEAMFFCLLGFYLFVRSKYKNQLLPYAVTVFMVSLFTYNSNKIIVPLLVLGLYYFNKDKIKRYPRKVLNISLIIILLGLTIFIYYAMVGQAFARVAYTNIFVLWKDLSEPKIYHFLWELGGRYLSYFSPHNLFIREPLEPVTVVAGNSMFYAPEFIFWLIGLSFVFKNYKKYKEVTFLMLIAPVPAIFTWNWFSPGRVMVLLSIYTILIAVGIVKVFKSNYWIAFVLLLFYAFYLFDSINIYLPVRDKGNYQYEFKVTVPEVSKIQDKYEKIVIDTPHAQPYIFYLFYGKYDPKKYLDNLDLDYIGTPRKYYDFYKYEFRDIDWEKDKNLKNTLFVSDNFPKDAKVLLEIKDRSGNLINKLVESNYEK